MRGLPTRWGSRALAGLVAERDELPVAKLREAGAVIFGKTNVPEFTMQGYTDNPVFGADAAIPWNPALTPGGSSGGAVALVAAGGCPIALGTDGGGSIRRPASHTNLVGLKPSRGRVPRGRRTAADLSRLRGGRADGALRRRRGRGDAGDRARCRAATSRGGLRASSTSRASAITRSIRRSRADRRRGAPARRARP